MQEEERGPEQEYGAQSPPALPPPLPSAPPRRPPPVLRRAPPRPSDSPIDPEAPVATGWLLLVTLAVWVCVGMGAVLLWLARPHSIEGVGSMLGTLVYLPLLVLLIVAGIATLLHGLTREGWALFGGMTSWWLLAGLVALYALYGPVKAIRALPVF